MTIPFLQIQPKALRLKVSPRFPAQLIGHGVDVVKQNGNYLLSLDYSDYPVQSVLPTSPYTYVLAWDAPTNQYVCIPLHLLTTSVIAYTEQDIVAGTTVNVAVTDAMIKINKTVGSPTTVILPVSSAKFGPVKIVDWKGDASTNNITVQVSASDKFNAGATSWVIDSDGASLVFTPLQDGSGYAI
jgi:hypothetical protein